MPSGWLHVLFWAGLRGAVAVAMALSLPADIPQRALLQEITFGVVLFTLLVQGSTIGWVVDKAIRSPHAKSRTRDGPDRTLTPAVQPPAGGVLGVGRLATPALTQDLVELGAVVPADRRPVEPLDVLDVVPSDLAERPAGVAPEVQDRPRWPARWRPGGAEPLGRAHRFVEATALVRASRRPVA